MATNQLFLSAGLLGCTFMFLGATASAQEPPEQVANDEVVVPHNRSPRDQAIWVLRSIRLPEPPLEDPTAELMNVLPLTADDVLGYLHDRRVPRLGEDPSQTLSIYQQALILDAVEQSDPLPMLAAVARLLSTSDSSLSVATAIEIYGVTGGAERLGTIHTHTKSLPEEELIGRLNEAIESALVALIRRDPQTMDQLTSTWRDWPIELVPSFIQAVGKARDPRGLEFLHEVTRWESDLQLLALSKIGLLGPSGDEYIDAPLADTVRKMIESKDGRIRKAAILALGGLRDLESIPLFIELLESESAGERGNAVWSLRRATGLQLNDQKQIWSVWFKRESDWYEQSNSVFQQLSSRIDGQVFDAIREVSLHSLHRDELAAEVAHCLGHSRVNIRVTACKGLGRLGSRTVVPQLIGMLLDRAEPVRMAARRALTDILGEDLGPNVEDWPSENV
ncbi:MAG: hypothetical protein ACI8TQ_000007 [Planctomycetota bacterium]|jgi:hypothetical protein